jgi:hypothetical protein
MCKGVKQVKMCKIDLNIRLDYILYYNNELLYNTKK